MAEKKIVVALDAGHGLKTSGKQTPDGIKEWTLNDRVCDKITAMLTKDYDVVVIRTDHNEGNVDESLASRLKEYMNADNVAVFVSIHHNAYNGKWNNSTGVEVFTDKNPTQDDIRLASCIYHRLVEYTGLKGRGIKKENWYVINQNKIPAVLVEGGFMDSNIDYKVITSEKGQDGYARAVTEGLAEFLGLQKKATSGWQKDSKGWWYKHKDGSYPKAQWLKLDTWYWFDENGYAVCNTWKFINEKWYYFKNDCRMATGWIKLENKWYYLNDSGAMVTGLQKINNSLYYFADDGHMCYTNDNGALV